MGPVVADRFSVKVKVSALGPGGLPVATVIGARVLTSSVPCQPQEALANEAANAAREAMSREWGQTVTTIPTPMVEGQSVAYDWMDLVRRVSDLEEENRSLRRQVYVGEHEFPDLTWKARCEELIGERLKLQDLVSELRENIRRLLDVVGDRLPCKGPTCTATIWFVRTKRGKITPYDGDACNHFATCPDAAKFKRKGDDK